MSLVVLMFLLALNPLAQSAAPAAAAPAIDNARVSVWDVTDGSFPAPPALDALTIEIVPQPGRVTFLPRGTRPAGAAAGTRRIVVSFKEVKVEPLPNRTQYPSAFPRPRSEKLVDNDRVVIWDYTWLPGQPTPTHFHDKDVVVVYLDNGALKSTTPDGMEVVNDYRLATIRFNLRERVHNEVLASGAQRAILVELK